MRISMSYSSQGPRDLVKPEHPIALFKCYTALHIGSQAPLRKFPMGGDAFSNHSSDFLVSVPFRERIFVWHGTSFSAVQSCARLCSHFLGRERTPGSDVCLGCGKLLTQIQAINHFLNVNLIR